MELKACIVNHANSEVKVFNLEAKALTFFFYSIPCTKTQMYVVDNSGAPRTRCDPKEGQVHTELRLIFCFPFIPNSMT